MSCSDGTITDEVTLYKGRDNAVAIIPYSDFSTRTNYDLSATTKIVANADAVGSVSVGDSVVGDSSVDPALVWWAQVTNDEANLEWRIYCKVGLFTGILAGQYLLRITLYAPSYTNGFVLPGTESDLLVNVIDLP